VGATDEGGIKLSLMDDKGPLRQKWKLCVFRGCKKRSSGSALDLLFCGPDLGVVDLFREKKHQQRGSFHRLEFLLALVAKRNEQSDSLRWAASGERFKNIFLIYQGVHAPQGRVGVLTNVLELPLNEFCNRYVN
jgi:hypothetical protein